MLCFCDGKTLVPMPASQDHKRAYDGDRGPNTGGMGAFAPVRCIRHSLPHAPSGRSCCQPCGLCRQRAWSSRGVLYVGLMLTDEGPKVVEYNARFGDPETQAVLPLLKSDLMEILIAVREQRLGRMQIRWSDQAAACVVLASGGYPGPYESGRAITGLEEAQAADAVVYHAGTKRGPDGFVTAGGRVLGVTALGGTLSEAVRRAYEAAGKIHFEGMHMRSDIGSRDLERTPS